MYRLCCLLLCKLFGSGLLAFGREGTDSVEDLEHLVIWVESFGVVSLKKVLDYRICWQLGIVGCRS